MEKRGTLILKNGGGGNVSLRIEYVHRGAVFLRGRRKEGLRWRCEDLSFWRGKGREFVFYNLERKEKGECFIYCVGG